MLGLAKREHLIIILLGNVYNLLGYFGDNEKMELKLLVFGQVYSFYTKVLSSFVFVPVGKTFDVMTWHNIKLESNYLAFKISLGFTVHS